MLVINNTISNLVLLGIYMFKVHNKSSRCHSDVFTGNFEHI